MCYRRKYAWELTFCNSRPKLLYMDNIIIKRSPPVGPVTRIPRPYPHCHRRQQATRASAHKDALAKQQRIIIIYIKPNCPLCEGTRDRVQGLIDRAQFMPSVLTEYTLEVRDISTDPAWSVAYAMEVPILTTLTVDGREVRIPRPGPRMTTDKLRQHLEAALPT
ncbi:hypothetical protein VaNZ11_011184 [Volvox africanus]|uniref:Glutaredoxin-like protein n=1 Tax=Volvox africanus TaxID=51714 RepID=A0ABQ5SB72_9CHLO|nr:hypothetical protein VaNZ11_011184 [Volvox africanus]